VPAVWKPKMKILAVKATQERSAHKVGKLLGDQWNGMEGKRGLEGREPWEFLRDCPAAMGGHCGCETNHGMGDHATQSLAGTADIKTTTTRETTWIKIKNKSRHNSIHTIDH